jgi:hypothetical protein
MKPVTSPTRRTVLIRLAQAAAVVPLASLTLNASAAKNDALRGSLKYQDTPKDGKQCSTCTQFVAGSGGKGTCKIIPGDDEIAATGWCSAYVEKK